MRYIFTVTAGRSGQNTLTNLLARHVPDSYAACEEPSPKLRLKRFSGRLASYENRFRRTFIETDELLGRGKVLKAFNEGDEGYLDKIVAKRLKMIRAKKTGIYIDVSKYFARGLHRAFARATPGFSLILLIRDPLLNMRSFLNRNKDFTLDNNPPDCASNLLRLDSSRMAKGELYLWAWCEMYLRYLKLIEEFNVQKHTIIRTSDLDDPGKMDQHLDRLGLIHTPCLPSPTLNKNPMPSLVSEEDKRTYADFIPKLPLSLLDQIPYLKNYDPDRAHGTAGTDLLKASSL